MGTPEFAVASMEELLKSGFEVVVAVTAPDRPAGRGRKMTASAVKKAAVKHQIPVLQPEKLKDPLFLADLAGYNIDLLIVVAFRMLPKAVWELPPYGTFNLHASLLPDYRGAAPINWAVINGETQTGVTTFFIDEQIDTGNIILQQSTFIGPEETAGELHDRLMALGAALVVETARIIGKGEVATQKQKHLSSAKSAPKLQRENCQINWQAAAGEVYDKIRGLSPYPGAWTYLIDNSEQIQVKVFKAVRSEAPGMSPPGTLKIEDQRMIVCAGDGWLELLEIQLPGKRRMTVREVLNGLKLQKNAHFL